MQGGGAEFARKARSLYFRKSEFVFCLGLSIFLSSCPPPPKPVAPFSTHGLPQGFFLFIRQFFLPAVAKCLLMWDHQIVGIFSQFSWIFTLKYKVPWEKC